MCLFVQSIVNLFLCAVPCKMWCLFCQKMHGEQIHPELHESPSENHSRNNVMSERNPLKNALTLRTTRPSTGQKNTADPKIGKNKEVKQWRRIGFWHFLASFVPLSRWLKIGGLWGAGEFSTLTLWETFRPQWPTCPALRPPTWL